MPPTTLAITVATVFRISIKSLRALVTSYNLNAPSAPNKLTITPLVPKPLLISRNSCTFTKNLAKTSLALSYAPDNICLPKNIILSFKVDIKPGIVLNAIVLANPLNFSNPSIIAFKAFSAGIL